MIHRRVLLLSLGVLLLGWPRSSDGQGTKPGGGGATTALDPRSRSPRTTVRTFRIAMNSAEDDPHKVEDAVACLDLSGMPTDGRDGGQFAFDLEFTLRSTNIPTCVIPDSMIGPESEIGEGEDFQAQPPPTIGRPPAVRRQLAPGIAQDTPAPRGAGRRRREG